MIWARMNQTTGLLTDIRRGVQQFPDDVPLIRFPTDPDGVEYGYDPATQTAVPQLDRRGKLAALDAWLAAKQAPGITVSGLTLAASVSDRTGYASLGAMYSTALLLGTMKATDPAKLRDKEGTWHALLNLGQVLGILLQYGAVQQATSEAFDGYAAKIAAAKTQADLDAITLS